VKGEKSKEFNFTLTKEDFNKVTDFSFQILDSTGKAVSKNALSYRSGGTVSVELPNDKDSANFVLELIPAFVNKELSAKIFVQELTYLPTPVQLEVKNAGKKSVTLYPNNIKTIDVKFVMPDIYKSDGSLGFGKIYFKSQSTNNTEYELPINFKY